MLALRSFRSRQGVIVQASVRSFSSSKANLSSAEAHILTDAELEFYEEHGYILVKKQLSLTKVDQYNKAFLDIIKGVISRPPTMLMMRDVSLVKKIKEGGATNVANEDTVTKIQDFKDVPEIFGYCEEPEIIRNVQRLIGEDLHAIHTMYINKPSDLGTGSSRHPPHQDLLYFPFRPERLICAAWTAMQNITEENGCLFVKPGSHKGVLLKHEYPDDGVVNKAYHGIQNMGLEEMVNVEMEAGDTLYFHPLLVHGSGPNLSEQFRKAVSCHYASGKVHEVSCVGTRQEELSDEIESMYEGKIGTKMDFIDIWRMKSAHVAGTPGPAFHLGWRRYWLTAKALVSMQLQKYKK